MTLYRELKQLVNVWNATADAEFKHFQKTGQFWRNQRANVWRDAAAELTECITTNAPKTHRKKAKKNVRTKRSKA